MQDFRMLSTRAYSLLSSDLGGKDLSGWVPYIDADPCDFPHDHDLIRLLLDNIDLKQRYLFISENTIRLPSEKCFDVP